MPQRETAIVGKNNVRAKVTGQEELLVNVNAINPAAELDVNLHDGSGTAITSTSDALGNTGIDVNIIGGVGIAVTVNLDQNDDQVQVYGSDLTAPIATDTNGHLQVDVLSAPNPTIAGPLGAQDCSDSIAVTLCNDQAQYLEDIKTAVATPFAMNINSINVPNGVTGDLDSPDTIKSITFYSTGTAPVTLSVNGGATTFPLAPGTSLNLDPGNSVAYYDGVTFQYNTTTAGATLLIVYNYI